MDNSQQQSRKPKSDMQSLPTRQYLDQTVAPILLQGLQTLAKGTNINNQTKYNKTNKFN